MKKSFLRIIAIAILTMIIVFGGYYFLIYRNNKLNNHNTNQSTTTTEKTTKEIKRVKIVDEDSSSRPYAIMINNLSTARPLQSGLQDAYIIYEFIVEAGITRYLALFLDSDTSRIGSIRSARHYFLDYALESDAIFVHNGYSPQAKSDFSALGVDRIEVNNTTTGWRDKTLKVSSEHTLFTNTEKLKNGIGKKRIIRNKQLLLNYNIEELDLSSYEGAIPASNIAIKYSSGTTSKYEYDNINKNYKRFVNNKEHKDYVTKEQYTFKNIITYQVKNSTISGDKKGRQTIDNVGNGTGYYISGGYAVPIKWSKNSRTDQTDYRLNDGTKLKVNDGNTFIQIQPKNQELTIN